MSFQNISELSFIHIKLRVIASQDENKKLSSLKKSKAKWENHNSLDIHSCDHTCFCTAKCDISPGEPLTITYCSALKPTQDRRATLRQSKLFWCLCERCRDPTEFGSHLSTLKCPKCKQDSVLPFSFVSPASESVGNLKWECQLGMITIAIWRWICISFHNFPIFDEYQTQPAEVLALP